jgi:transcriptional regulator with XRE-family HTH domain
MPVRPDAIREAREKRGLTQQQAADAAGIARSHWALLETGRRPDPQLSSVEAIARALGVAVAAIITE